MDGFGYCVWYLPKDTGSPHDWSRLTKHFPCHITISKNLSFFQAAKLYHDIVPQSIEFELRGQVVSYSSGFHSLYFNLEPLSHDLPSWLPESPHVSFEYSYDSFLECGKEPLVQKSTFHKIALVNCSGHYTKWSFIEVKY